MISGKNKFPLRYCVQGASLKKKNLIRQIAHEAFVFTCLGTIWLRRVSVSRSTARYTLRWAGLAFLSESVQLAFTSEPGIAFKPLASERCAALLIQTVPGDTIFTTQNADPAPRPSDTVST